MMKAITRQSCGRERIYLFPSRLGFDPLCCPSSSLIHESRLLPITALIIWRIGNAEAMELAIQPAVSSPQLYNF